MYNFYVCSIKPALKAALDDDVVISGDGIQSQRYHLLAGDLRDMETLGEKILSSGVNTW